MTRAPTTRFALHHLILAAALACALPASQAAGGDWFGGDKVQGSTIVKRETRALGHFTGVALSLPAKVEVRIGNTESVSIETDDNLLPLVETVIENGTLQLRPNKRNLSFKTRHMKIVVQAKSLDHISIGGSGSIDADALRGDKVSINVGGAGSIVLKGIEADHAIIAVGGSGSLTSGPGSLDNVSIMIGGSGDVNIGKVKARNAKISVAGSGEAIVWVSDGLNTSIAGSGDVKYYGSPTVSKSTAGSGTTRRLGDAPQR
ncbi:head GIN domain-containing protein [Massilia pseudoviolaceinigra]|uniref:head GIN domain-containing protein n=1 Tax=Massilia pseudoviolaceinigra TaxID=3057165 RepID=UPI0027969225|nr:head GIN domain-containing protein [Massilia sp. CCM 9206]MDQ1920965.1 head GIN domain-containing protein [Massilia sp. CCM 9206]